MKAKRKREKKASMKIQRLQVVLEASKQIPEMHGLKPRQISKMLGVDRSLVYKLK